MPSFFAKMTRQLLGALVSRKSASASDFFTGEDVRRARSLGGRTADVVSPYRQSWAVHAGVAAIARNLKSLPFVIKSGSFDSKKGMPILPTDPWVKLFNRPSILMSAAEMWESIPIDLALFGEWIWLKWSKDGIPAKPNEIPAELIRIHPRRALHHVDPTTALIDQWSIQVHGNQRYTVPADSVIHNRLYNPDDDYRGLAAIEACRTGIALDYKADSSTTALLDNDCTPGGYLKFSTPMTQAKLDEATSKWKDLLKGERKRGGLAALGKDADYVPLSFSSKDMQMPLQREMSEQQIRACLGVTPMELGDLGDHNRAQMQAALWFFWKSTMIPLSKAVPDALHSQMFRYFGGPQGALWGEFDLSKVDALLPDLLDKIAAVQGLVTAGWSADQGAARIGLDMPPAEGALALPGDGVMIGQGGGAGSGGVPVGGGSGGPAALVAVGGGGGPAGAGVAVKTNSPSRESPAGTPYVGNGLAREPRSPATGPKQSALQAGPPASFHRKIAARRTSARAIRQWNEKASRKIGRQLSKFYRQLRDEAIDRVAPEKSIEPLSEAEVDTLLGAPATWRQLADDYLSQTMQGVARSAVANAGQIIGGFDVVTLEDPRWIVQAAQRTAQMIRVASRWRSRIRERIVRSIAEDQSITSLASLIDREFGEVIKSNGMVIARTEAGMIGESLRLQVFKAEGVEQKEWSTTNDDHVRETHKDMDGETVGIDERFSNGLDTPLDPSGPPEEIIQCRCTSLPVA